MEFAPPNALLERLATTEREIVFLVGAPISAPSPTSSLGVPGVAAMIARIQTRAQDRPRAAQDLERALADDRTNPYQAAFRHVLQFRGPDAANSIVRDAVFEARLPGVGAVPAHVTEGALRQLENDLDGWHYSPAIEALGQLIARYPGRFGGTVLTTNFDPLIELSIRRARGRAFSTMLHGDGSIEQSRGDGCHVVHVHGYWYGTDTLHAPLQLLQERPQLRASLARLLNNRTLVILAYGGWDDIVTRTLQDLTADQGAFPDLLWCFYDRDAEVILRNNARIFDQLRPAIARQRITFYAGIDCHAVLPELAAELGRAAGEVTVVQPDDGPTRDGFVERGAACGILLHAMERGQPVQVLGLPRMGKSSLLRWVERRARSLGKGVAFINARGLEGRSPSDLVLAVAEAVGRRREVREVLFAESVMPDVRAAERALALLLPVCLLVDEADALAERDHGFDRGFFDMLRAMGQDGRLVWISASEGDLFDHFHATGLTSAFLNDARKLTVGALSRIEAERLVRERASGTTFAAWACEVAGGFPPALARVAEQLAAGRVDLDKIEAELRRWSAPLFTLWWLRLDEDRRRLLKESAERRVQVAGLSDTERRKGRALVERGLLAEHDGGFVLWGRAWKGFVCDAG